MFTIPLPLPDSSLVMAPPWSHMPAVLQGLILALVCVVPLALILWLYRYELKLVSGGTALLLLGLRLVALAVLLLLVCLQPIYARERTINLPGRVLVVVDRSTSMDVADTQRSPAEKLRLA